MQCSKCGNQMKEGDSFCMKCGAPAGNAGHPIPNPNPAQNMNQNQGFSGNVGMGYVPNNPAPINYPAAGNQDPNFDYTPISMWGYFGYEILFAIPCIGFILLLVFSFGGTKNINLRNFARSYFCVLIIAVILAVIIIVAGGALGIASGF